MTVLNANTARRTMETDELTVLDPNVDFSQVPPIHQKRTIAFINHFVMRTVSFLNTFAESCETRLMEYEQKLRNVESSLLILESQLSSVPWLDDIDTEKPVESEPEAGVVAENDEVRNDVHTERTLAGDGNGHKASEDARYVRFFKMVQFGVPSAAVKLKMEMEGLDPNVLDNPNTVIPGDCNNDDVTDVIVEK